MTVQDKKEWTMTASALVMLTWAATHQVILGEDVTKRAVTFYQFTIDSNGHGGHLRKTIQFTEN